MRSHMCLALAIVSLMATGNGAYAQAHFPVMPPPPATCANAPSGCAWTAKGASTSVAGTVVTSGTFQSVLAASPTRKGCYIVNKSTTTYLAVFLGAPGSATLGTSIMLKAAANANEDGGSMSCNTPGLVVTDQISVTSGSNGSAFLAISQ